MLYNSNGILPHLQMEVAVMGFDEDLLGRLSEFMKIQFLPQLECFICKQKFEYNFFKNDPIA